MNHVFFVNKGNGTVKTVATLCGPRPGMSDDEVRAWVLSDEVKDLRATLSVEQMNRLTEAERGIAADLQ